MSEKKTEIFNSWESHQIISLMISENSDLKNYLHRKADKKNQIRCIRILEVIKIYYYHRVSILGTNSNY